MSNKLNKNWSAICQLTNPLFRLSVALLEDQSLLGKLAQGFPELFSPEPQQPSGPFPVSLIRELTQQLTDKDYLGDNDYDGSCGVFDQKVDWLLALEHLNIPVISFQEVAVPGNVLNELVGQTLGCGMQLTYQGVEMVAVNCVNEWDLDAYGKYKITHEDGIALWCLYICPASFFDFNA